MGSSWRDLFRTRCKAIVDGRYVMMTVGTGLGEAMTQVFQVTLCKRLRFHLGSCRG